MSIQNSDQVNHTGKILFNNVGHVEGGLRKRGLYKKVLIGRPLISVITVVLNGEKFLEKTIQSVINQTYSNVEYIIIDGGSIDGTLDIIRKYDNVIDYWISEKDYGIYNGMNKGVSYATGSWINFINSDDFLWNESVLDLIAKSLENLSPEIRIAYGQIILLSTLGESLYAIGKPFNELKKYFNQIMVIPHPGVFHSRSFFERNGLFDESFHIAGDYEILLRELIKGSATFIPNIVVAGMRQGGISNKPEHALHSLREVRRAQIKHGLPYPGSIWILAVTRVCIRLLLWRIFGDKIARRLLDLGRRIMGKSSVWVVD